MCQPALWHRLDYSNIVKTHIESGKPKLMPILALLFVNALITALCFFILWMVARRLNDVSFIDSWWALGIVLTAWVSFMNSAPNTPHAIALTVLCTLWGLRLGGYLFWRWRSHGPDRRYKSLLGKAQTEKNWSFAKASFWMVFALQAPLQWIVSLPVQIGQMAGPMPLGPIAWLGLSLCIVGLTFETLGDWQLTRFKADPTNAGKVMDQGLWRYTRHPNYFGDTCFWWGMFFIAADTSAGIWSLPGPILLTVLLIKVSGIPTTEHHMAKRKPGYGEYMRRTSSFLPWPPKA